MNSAVFLDKDGTLIKNSPYSTDFDIREEVLQALKRLKRGGYKLILVSNQSGVARGYFSERELLDSFNELQKKLIKEGIYLDGIYYCPHHPEGTVQAYSISCRCRKPKEGMLKKASQEHDIDLKKSWMIGDILDDMEAGKRSGCRTILVNPQNETEWHLTNLRKPDYIFGDLCSAAQGIYGRKIH